MDKKFLLIDGSSLIFRAFFAIRNLTTKDGIHTNGVYGFLNMYMKALEMVEPDYIAVAFDRPGPTFRNKDYEAYKGHRDKTPPELSHQFAILKDVLDSLNVIHIDMKDYEADDILGTLSSMANEKKVQTYMLTGDRDYFQLVGEKAKVLYTKKGISELEIYDIDKIRESYGVDPTDLIEVKGLMGDSSDNIPGVPGIGEKTAIKLVKEYGNIEGIYENIDKISGKKMKENLQENETLAYLSRKLGKIFTSVPLDYDLEDFKKREANKKEVFDKFKKLEFNRFMEMFADESDLEASANTLENFTIVDDEKLSSLVDEIRKDKKFYFEIFIDGENYIGKDIGYLGLCSQAGRVIILDFKKDPDRYIASLKGLFEDKEIEKVSFDIKKAIYLLDKYGVKLHDNYLDIMLLAYLANPSRTGFGIDQIAQYYLDRQMPSEETLLGKGRSKKTFADLEEDRRKAYIAGYISIIKDSTEKMLEEIEELGMKDLLYSIELPLINILARMEIKGVKVERKELEKVDRDISKDIDLLEKEIYDLADLEFNINSPKQLGEVLFEKLGLPVIKKTKTGYSTNAEVLDKLRDSHEIIDKIINYRGLKKLKSTYIDGLYPYIMEDGRVRSIFRQTITATGRLSSTEPNLQNIPIRTEEGRLIRKAFACPEGSRLISADYSQIELRVLAALSKDDNMLDAFKHGIDIHTKTASEVFKVSLDEVTRNQRADAKAVNFGIVYGISDYGLSRDLNISRKEAKSYIENYLDSYPNISKYMDQIIVDAKDKGYVETIFHRRRYVPELNSKNFAIRSFGERIALNTPIQGSAADIIKVAMVKVYRRLLEEGLKSKIILQIHDELIIETLDEEADKVKKILKEEMEGAVKLDVDLLVDIDEGKTWYEV